MDQQKTQGGFKAITRSVGWAIWRFIGRMGLAFRKLLTWFIWIPLYFLTMPIWMPISWAWEFIKPIFPYSWKLLGRMGLAIRKLWHWLIWEPLLWLLIPFVWLGRRIIWPALVWIAQTFKATFLTVYRYLMRVSAPRRHLWRRRLRSRWVVFKSRLRVLVKRPSYVLKAEMAPSVPIPEGTYQGGLRLATAFATVAVLLTVGIISLQERQAEVASASDESPVTLFNPPEIIVLTPTPLPPSPTPIPTAVLTPWPTPDVTKGGGAILFSQTQNGNSDIYLLPVGQSEAVRLTTHPRQDRSPSWSPDGSKFAFASNRNGPWDIFVYDIRLGELQQVTNDLHFDDAPAWSPDGQWLAYESYQDDNLDIFIVELSDPNPLQITRNPAADYAPSWEPINGRNLAFTSWRSGGPDIFIRSLDDPLGERVINITNSPAQFEDGAVFSPDGRFLAYAVTENDFSLINGVALSENMLPLGAPQNLGQQGQFPAWSPDNEALVYVYERDEQSFLVAGSPEAWGVTPQVYAASGNISSPSWTAVQFTPRMVNTLVNIDDALLAESIEVDAPLFVEAIADPVDGLPAIQLFELPINAPSPYLSDRVDQSFLAFRERIIADAGWDVVGRLDGMFMQLTERSLPGQTVQDWNKAGRAFDLAYQEALSLDPRVEVVQERIGSETYWRVFVKAELQDGTQGEPLKAVPWDFRARTGDDPQYYDQGGKLRDGIPTGYYVDLTAVAEQYGWTRLPAGPNWKTYFPDINFWHFENRQGLTWEEAMLEIYTPAELAILP
ncbi:MAG: hypothetical protein AAF490_06915 [Chloroflexota bacterium]